LQVLLQAFLQFVSLDLLHLLQVYLLFVLIFELLELHLHLSLFGQASSLDTAHCVPLASLHALGNSVWLGEHNAAQVAAVGREAGVVLGVGVLDSVVEDAYLGLQGDQLVLEHIVLLPQLDEFEFQQVLGLALLVELLDVVVEGLYL
jgi:hypothetical protein